MSTNRQFLIGSVLERKPNAIATPPRPIGLNSQGFPTAQHRSKSAFARNREEARKLASTAKETRPQAPPVIASNSRIDTGDAGPERPTTDDWRERMSTENEMRVANMTDDERDAEKQDILERFGAGIGDVLMRARLAREKNPAKDRWPTQKPKPTSPVPPPKVDHTEVFGELPEVPITEDEPTPSKPSGRGLSPPPALSRPNSRPSSRLDRKLRFAELGPSDVFVYESAPPSPKKQPLALPPAVNDGTAVSLGQWKGKMAPQSGALGQEQPLPSLLSGIDELSKEGSRGVDEPEEGTAEYIRRRYFPDAPANDPNLAWMQSNPLPEPPAQSSNSLRFDLHGNVIPLSVATKLPSHLGLHHHAEGLTAGYTLDDIFLLSRSTVPAQRAAMLGVLASIVTNLAKAKRGKFADLAQLLPRAEEIRKRVMAAGIEAMNERGSVGARAIQVVWASIVVWDEEITDLEGVELQQNSDTAIASIQLDFFLPQIATALSQGDTLPESLNQLLAVLHRLGQYSNKIAESITRTPKLLTSVFQAFLLTPIPPRENGSLPEPAALQLLITLASASRANAEALKEPTDTLLRFITPLPPSSPFSPALATSLLALTLRLYATLASYGLYSNIAATAMEPLSQLNQYVFSACTSQKVTVAWLNLLNAWTVCAIDPHMTMPDHDILWSQVVGWGWKDDIAQFSHGLGSQREDWVVWDAVWRAQAQWLEGSKVNGVKGGEAERLEFMESARSGFQGGTKGQVVLLAVDALQEEFGVENATRNLEGAASCAGLLSAVIRLWLACLPPRLIGPPPSPPFELPFPLISEVCAKLLTHSLWENIFSSDVDPRNYIHARRLSELLATYLALSRRLPGTPEELWVAQALSILSRLLPGDEDIATSIVEELLGLVTLDWVNQRQIASPIIIWDKDGLSILKPFLLHMILPNKQIRIAPLSITPRSITRSSTLRLPMTSQRQSFGLPLHRDWTLTPMNHLLRSAESDVFKHLPAGWDSSELDVTRVTLFLSNLGRDALTRFSLNKFALSREEAIFGCMRVFMLEHGQPDNDSSAEMFRDPVVGRLMGQMLEPYSYGVSRKTLASASTADPTLEQVATRFLGGSTPFFQFYTDFVALYDAISFSDATFAKLLFPPTSTRYAVDYRKHLWVDFNHILKTTRTPCEEVLSSDLKEYLYPIEDDPQLIGVYLRALLKEPLQGFCRLVAIHQIASNIWPDLWDEGSSNEARAEKLIKAITTQGSNEVVREVASYRQTSLGVIRMPPECFEHVAEVANARFNWLTELGDEVVTARLRGLLT